MIEPLDIAHLASERDVSRYVNAHGVRLPSVTEVLALAGMVDLSGIPLELLERGAARGRQVHHLTAAMDRGEGIRANTAGLYMHAWHAFRSETGFVPRLIETSLVSERFHFAGTFDRFGFEKNGRAVLLDLKTSASPSHWWALQLAGYQVLISENRWRAELADAVDPLERWGVQLKSDGDYSVHRYRSPADRSDFLAALRVAHWLLRTKRYVLP